MHILVWREGREREERYEEALCNRIFCCDRCDRCDRETVLFCVWLFIILLFFTAKKKEGGGFLKEMCAVVAAI